MKRIQNEDLKYEPTSGQNIILGSKSHMGAILTYMATVRLFKTEKQVKMAKNSTFFLLLSHSMGKMYQICVLDSGGKLEPIRVIWDCPGDVWTYPAITNWPQSLKNRSKIDKMGKNVNILFLKNCIHH